METKGYLRKAENATILRKNLRRFRRAGVPLSAITVGGDITRVIDSLESGDCLVVISIDDLSPQKTRQKELLARITERGITIKPLDRVDAMYEPKDDGMFSRFLRRMGLKTPVVECDSSQTPASQISREMQSRARLCLKPYYQLKKGVEAICENVGISTGTLYQFLRENNLPNRREVRNRPEINPLRKPGFPGNLPTAQPDSEKTESICLCGENVGKIAKEKSSKKLMFN